MPGHLLHQHHLMGPANYDDEVLIVREQHYMLTESKAIHDFPRATVPFIKNINGISPTNTTASTQNPSMNASAVACRCTIPYSIACARTAASAIDHPC